MITVFILSSDGTSNIMSDIASSIIEQKSSRTCISFNRFISDCLYRVIFKFKALHRQMQTKALYCFISAFFRFCKNCNKRFSVKFIKSCKTGSLPINSGINPNLSKSCGISLPSNSLMLDSFLLEICARKSQTLLTCS